MKVYVNDLSEQAEVTPTKFKVAKEPEVTLKVTQPLPFIPMPPRLFPQRLQKKVEDGKF